jgi:hypothetical protein
MLRLLASPFGRIPALVLAAALAGCASSPDGADERLVGCWFFERDAAARELNLPWGVRLLGDSLAGWPTVDRARGTPRVAVTLRGRGRTADHPFGYWQATAEDSVRIGYPGTGGLLLALELEEQAMEGTARPVGDAGLEPRATHPVRLTRARCPES